MVGLYLFVVLLACFAVVSFGMAQAKAPNENEK
jgi:hypothetical protein